MSGKLPISLVVITYNEAKNLPRCLLEADFCAELIIVDSGSTDGTRDIAREFGARVVHRNWSGYRDQKAFGIELAAQPWILTLDADEVITSQLRDDIEQTFAADPREDAFEINRRSFYSGKRINHSGWYPQWRLLLFRKGKAYWSEKEPHEVLTFCGRTKGRLSGDLNHYTYESIRRHVEKNLDYATRWATTMHNGRRRATTLDLLFRGPWGFFRTYILQLGFLDGFYGLVIAAVTGYYTFVKYSMLKELNRRPAQDEKSDEKNG